MRGIPGVAVAIFLMATVLAGCLSDEAPDPGDGRPRAPDGEKSQRAFDAAEAAAREAAGGGDLVAAVGIASANPDRLEEVSSTFPELGKIAKRLKATKSAVPGTGDLPAWAFIFQNEGGLNYAVVEKDGDVFGATVDGTMDASELSLLRTQGTMDKTPFTSPADALEQALADKEWGAVASGSGFFVLYLLVAGSGGTPEWRMVVSPHELDPNQGRTVVVDDDSGERRGVAQPWPDNESRRNDNRDDNPMRIPGDTETFEWGIEEEGHPALYVMPSHSSNLGSIAGRPDVVLNIGSDSHDLEMGSQYKVEDPVAGDLDVVWEWNVPDYYRSIRVTYCVLPQPFLFAEQLDICDESE